MKHWMTTVLVGVAIAATVAFLTPAAAAACDVNLDTWNGASWDRTFVAPHYSSKVTFRVRVSPSSCTWRLDGQGTPSWISLVVVEGASAGNGWYRGNGLVDVFVAANSSYARSGRFKVVSSYAVPVDVTQYHGVNLCSMNPTEPGWNSVAPGFSVFTQTAALPTTNFLAQLIDQGTCPLSPRPLSYTPGMTGGTIQRVSGQSRGYSIYRPGVRANSNGEAGLFALNQPGYTTSSGLLALSVVPTASLPPGLQVRSYSLRKPVASYGTAGRVLPFGDIGGIIRITGTSTRLAPTPDRPCLFTPTYHRVVGGSWLTVTSESGCGNDPDQGTLVIAVSPGSLSRVGAIFTPWGSVLFVVQGGP